MTPRRRMPERRARAARGVALFVCAVAALAAGLRIAGEGDVAKADDSAGAELIHAAERGDAARVEALLSTGLAVDMRDADGRTLLLLAVRADEIATARLLVAAGADVNAVDRIDDTPFLYAGAEGRNEILKLILATGRADLASTNRYGGTALIPVAHHGHVETVRILLGAGMDVDHVNRLGWTALLETVILGDGGAAHTEILRLLIEAGADVNIADSNGVTALTHARSRGFVAMMDILSRAGAK